jgi:hypothetical protein
MPRRTFANRHPHCLETAKRLPDAGAGGRFASPRPCYRMAVCDSRKRYTKAAMSSLSREFPNSRGNGTNAVGEGRCASRQLLGYWRDPVQENWAAVLCSLGAAKFESYRFYFIGLDRLTACAMGNLSNTTAHRQRACWPI